MNTPVRIPRCRTCRTALSGTHGSCPHCASHRTRRREQPPDPARFETRFHIALIEDWEAIHELSGRMVAASMRSEPDPSLLLPAIDDMARLLEDARSSFFGLQGSRGISAASLAHHTRLSDERVRKKYAREETARRLAEHEHTRRTTSPDAGIVPAGQAMHDVDERSPAQRLLKALRHVYRAHGRTQRDLARALGLSPSYVSKLLGGSRPLTWNHVKTICEQSGLDPAVLFPLYGAAVGGIGGQLLDPDRAAGTFRYYLQALRLASGEPSTGDLINAGESLLSRGELGIAFNGPHVPEWNVVRRLADALTSHPEDIKPLWKAASAAAELPNASPLPAEAFG